jgi:hypothetical protein
MENATKAFYIAASTLIAIMILLFMLAIFRKTANISSSYDNNLNQQSIEAFNAEFNVFASTENVAADVVSAVNLAYNVNKNNYYDPVNNVEVYIYMKDNTSGDPNYSLLNDEANSVKDSMFIGKVPNKTNIINNNDFMRLEVNTGKRLNDVKYDKDLGKMVYRYYFTGVTEYNEKNGKVNKLIFTLSETLDF